MSRCPNGDQRASAKVYLKHRRLWKGIIGRMAITREDLKELPKLLRDNPELRLQIAEQILDEAVVSELMRRSETLREVFRNAVYIQDLMRMPQEFREFREETTQRFIRVEADVAEIKERVARVEADGVETKERVTRLEDLMQDTRQAVRRLEDWRQGELARRAGEEYEDKILRRAGRIFGGGEGGSPRESERVRQQLDAWLHQAGINDFDYEDEDEPADADIIWWKGEAVAVGEVSLKVDKYDVYRVKRRAEVLRRAGLEVLPVVIGKEWAHPETQQIAEQEGVAWRVGNSVSDALIEYHRRAPTG